MEFFLVLPMVALILVAGLQVIGVAKARIELVGAVREGARVAATTPDPASAVDAVQEALPSAARDKVRVSVSRPEAAGKMARVKATLPYDLAVPLTGLRVSITATAAMVVER